MKFAVLLLLIVGSTIAFGYQYVPIDNCNQDNEYLKPNTISSYKYEVGAKTKAFQRTANSFGLNFRCQVEVVSGSRCLHTLKVTECTLSETDPNIEGVAEEKPHPDSVGFSAAMQKHPLKFTLTNGTVVNIITDDDESLPILNVKRGIVSALAAKKPSAVSSDDVEMLTDVQGVCPVNYTVVDSNTVKMYKDINHCHLPSRIDWHYSPFSMMWNMTFLQNYLIDAEAHCLYTFSNDGLKQSICGDTHAIRTPDLADSNAISIKTIVSRELTLMNVSPKSGADAPIPEIAKSIVYEYERTPVPKTAPADLRSKAQYLMEKLLYGMHPRITPGIGKHFTDLVELFRQATELQTLEEIAKPCVDLNQPCLTYSDLKQNQKEMINQMAMKFFVDALVQCNSVPCIREVRRLDEKGQVGGRQMDAVLRAWSRIKITDTDIFAEIREICNRVQTRTCYLSLSAAIHRYWTQNKHAFGQGKTLPKSVEASIKDLFDLFNTDCSGPERATLMGLKALGNLGAIAERVYPNVENVIDQCVHNDKASWAVKVSAVQAARRLEPTTALFTKLYEIVKDTSLDLDVRVWAYKIIIKRWQDKDTLVVIKQFLDSPEATYQLKKFIASNLRTLLKDRSNMNAIRFAKLIREVFTHREIDDPSPDISEKQRRESLELEGGAYHKVPYLDDAIDQFGLRLLVANMFDGKYFLPFSSFINVTVQLFGRDINFLEFLHSTRNQARTIAALADHFATTDEDEALDLGDFMDAVFENSEDIKNYKVDPDTPVKFDYKVDATMQQNLERIRKMFPIGFDPADIASFLISYRIFGDEMGFTTQEFMKETIQRYKAGLVEVIQNPQHRSGAASIIEAFHLVPTMAGLPLNWTSNVVAIYHLDYSVPAKVEISASFSATIEEESSMIVSLPGYAHGSITTYSTETMALDTGLSVTANEGSGVALGVRFPKEDVKLQYSRRNTGSTRKAKVDLEEPSLAVKKDSWCSDIIGVKVCHKSSHAKLDNVLDDHWALMSRNANWELSFNFGERAGKMLYTRVKSSDVPDTVNIDVYLEGKENDKALSLAAESDDEKGLHNLQFTIPKLGIRVDAAEKRNDEQGETTLISADVMGRKYQLEYRTGQKVMEMKKVDLPHYEILDKKVKLVDVYSNVATLRSPQNLYTWNRTQASFLNADYIEHVLMFQPTQGRAEADRYFPDFWENPHLAWIKLGLQEVDVMEDSGHGYAYLKAPKFIIEGFEELVYMDDKNSGGYVNLSIKSLPDNKLQSFVNLTFGRSSEQESEENDGTAKNEFELGLALPRVSWSLEIESHRKSQPYVAAGFKAAIRRTAITAKDDQYENEIEYWTPSNANHFNVESGAFEIGANYKTKEADDDKTETELNGHLGFPGYEPITMNVMQTSHSLKPGYAMNSDLTIKNPNSDWAWKTTEKLVYNPPKNAGSTAEMMKGYYKHRSAFSNPSAPTEEYGIYVIDAELDSDALRATEYFRSQVYVYNGTLVWKYKAPEYSDLTIDILAESPVWEFLNLKLKQVVFYKGEKMSLWNSLVDIDVEGSWQSGYQKKVDFKSKNTNLMPNMHWDIDFKDGSGVVKYDFPDRNLKIVEHVTMSDDHKEIRITFCKHHKCEDPEKDADVFISQYTYTLDDPTHMAETVIQNPQYVKEIDDMLEQRMEKWAEWLVDATGDPEHPINKIAEPVLGMTIIEYCTSVLINAAMTGASASKATVTTLFTLEPFARPATRYFVGGKKDGDQPAPAHRQSSYPPAKLDSHEKHLDMHLVHYIPWNYYSLADMQQCYRDAMKDMDTNELSVAPGPIPGRSHVYAFEMPIKIETFTSAPTINAKYFQEKREKQEDLTEVLHYLMDDIPQGGDEDDDDDEESDRDHPPFEHTFRYRKYTRFALLWGVGRVLTFDGQHVDLPSPLRGDCSHLLLHNRVDGQVTIARGSNSLLLMFPEVKIKLMHNGRVVVNDSSEVTDLPVHGRKVNVTRQEAIIEVATYHHLNIKCSLSEDYCLFGTNEFTHNSLVGILGNNNGDPTDDIQQKSGDEDPATTTAPFLLSPKGACKTPSRSDTCSKANLDTDVCFGELNPRFTYDYKTQNCDQIINHDEFDKRCRHDQVCRGNGCASQMAYRALCGAHGIPMEAFGKCSSCANGMEMDETDSITVKAEADIIFLVDTAQKTYPSESENRVITIAKQIDETFKGKGIKSVSFGLLVFTSTEDHEDYAEQYAMNGKIYGALDEFINQGVKRVDFHQVEPDDEPNAEVLVDALDASTRYYPLRPTATRLLLLITPEDVDKHIDIDDVRTGVKEIEPENLFAISAYPEMDKLGKNVLAKPGTEDPPLDRYPHGLHARWVFASDGVLMNSRSLEDDRKSLPTFAQAMMHRVKSAVGKCRVCHCGYPVTYTPFLSCAAASDC